MKRYLAILLAGCAVVLAAAPSLGQVATRRDDVVLSTGPGSAPLTVAPNAVIRVCTSTATYGGGVPCSPLATLYTDSTEAFPAQNPFNADSQGRFSLYADPGVYVLETVYAGQYSDLPDYRVGGTGGSSGGGLLAANNLSDVADVPTSRTNLGLGTAAVQSTTAFLLPGNNLSDLVNDSTARGNLGVPPTGDVNSLGVVTKIEGGAIPANAPGVKTNGPGQLVSQTGTDVGGMIFAADSGAADVLTACPTPAIASLTDGLTVRIKVLHDNATTTPTLNLCSLGAKTIVTRQGAAAKAAGDLKANGYAEFIYELGNTRWQFLSKSGLAASGGSTGFDALTPGTNTTAAMVVGSGGALSTSGTGTIGGAIKVGSTFKLLAWIPQVVAVCQGSTTTSAALALSYGATGTTNPNPICKQGTATTPQLGAAQFTATGQQLHGHFSLPPDWNPNSIMLVQFISAEETDTNTAHNEIWNWTYVCAHPGGGTLQPTYGSTQPTTSTANVPSAITLSGVATLVPTVTSCSAGDELYYVISLDASRTATGQVDLYEVDHQILNAKVTQ